MLALGLLTSWQSTVSKHVMKTNASLCTGQREETSQTATD